MLFLNGALREMGFLSTKEIGRDRRILYILTYTFKRIFQAHVGIYKYKYIYTYHTWILTYRYSAKTVLNYLFRAIARFKG